MRFLTESEERAERLLDEISNHPLTVGIREKAAAERLRKREDTAKKIKNLKKERDSRLPELQADLSNKQEEYLKAKAVLDTTLLECQKANSALSEASHRFSHEIGLLEQVLIDSASPELDEAVEFFQETLDNLRRPGRIRTIGRKDQKDPVKWTKKVVRETNYGAVVSALQYCQASIEELKRMKLSPVLDFEKIEQLKGEIPGIDVYEETTGEQNMERTPIHPTD